MLFSVVSIEIDNIIVDSAPARLPAKESDIAFLVFDIYNFSNFSILSYQRE